MCSCDLAIEDWTVDMRGDDCGWRSAFVGVCVSRVRVSILCGVSCEQVYYAGSSLWVCKSAGLRE